MICMFQRGVVVKDVLALELGLQLGSIIFIWVPLPVWKNESSRRGWVTGCLPQNYENKNKKKESEKKQGGDQKEYVALMQTIKLKLSGVGFPAHSKESGAGVLTRLVHLVF